ncbi:putative head processing protein [Escherichia coli]|uniref:Putative head processing protein n=1 Tax=Escherichia coli TaxID=562 RepID=A0A376YJL1_ECOLX|nr:putative head processing protein [Escherichia coli]
MTDVLKTVTDRFCLYSNARKVARTGDSMYKRGKDHA